jgi:hypothetical protein
MFFVFLTVAILIILMGMYLRSQMKIVEETQLQKLDRLDDIELKVDEVHRLVNSRLSSVLDRVDQLTKSLTDAGEEVPDDPADPRIR